MRRRFFSRLNLGHGVKWVLSPLLPLSPRHRCYHCPHCHHCTMSPSPLSVTLLPLSPQPPNRLKESVHSRPSVVHIHDQVLYTNSLTQTCSIFDDEIISAPLEHILPHEQRNFSVKCKSWVNRNDWSSFHRTQVSRSRRNTTTKAATHGKLEPYSGTNVVPAA